MGLTQARPKNLQKLIYQLFYEYYLLYGSKGMSAEEKHVYLTIFIVLCYVRCQMVFKSSNYTTITFIIPYLNDLCVTYR